MPPSKQMPRGAKNNKKIAKSVASTPGRLGFLEIEKRPGTFAMYPGRSFPRFFERKAPCGEPTTREGVRKGSAAEAERDASQHAVGGTARVFFFSSYLFINSSFFFTCVSTSGPNTTRPTFFFFLETYRGVPSALFLF